MILSDNIRAMVVRMGSPKKIDINGAMDERRMAQAMLMLKLKKKIEHSSI
jgi:hypothetical protein